MAESVVSFVVGMLGDAYVKEVLHLQGVGDRVERVRRELSRIQAFLKDTDRKHIVDERQNQFVKEVRDLAYLIEDVIDTLIAEVPEKKPGKIEAVKRWLTGIIKLPTIHRHGHEIKKIEEMIREIEASRLRYGITKLGGANKEENTQLVRRIVLPDVDEDGIVGFEADRGKIIDLLLDEKTTGRSVVSIVGPGGLGKTTLARKVYNSEVVKRHFDIRIWVVISQKFELIDIFRNIAKQLKIQPPEDLSEHELTKLHQSLTKKRYFLVLDDIWKNNNPLTQIEGIFPNSNNRSRVLITTRFLDVAEKSGPISIPHKLQFLTEESSIKLLLKKALPSHNADDKYPHNLYNIGRQFAKRCGGLPLALIVLGGLLSKKDPNYIAWSSVMQTMNWGTHGEECTAIIGTSYDDLPFGLKSCFMYFAAFPEDADIKVRKLLRMWIAEGFIPQEQNRTLEDTAHSFLVDLVQRSMIQATRTDFAGYILGCRIHDLLHGLAIQKAKEDNFLMVCSKVEELQNCSHVRRLAIHDSNYERDEELYCKIIPNQIPNLRSLFAKQLTSPMVPQHLKVWSDFYWISDTHVFKKIERLSQLRYLELTIQVKTREEIRNFQEFIGAMRFLRTLDLQFSTIECDLPESLWHVKTLRNVILPFPKSSTNGPAPSLNLINLQTLRGVKCRESWGEEGIPNLPNLKSFAILASNRSQWNAIADLLYKLNHLIILSIHVDGIALNIIDMRNFPCYNNLQFLHLYGNGNEINLDQCLLPIHLTRLVLEHLQFQKDPMPVIEKFENLKFFWLKNCKIQQLCCLTTGGFGRLESLTLEELQELEEWKIDDGAMPKLKTLVVIACPRLRVPPGLQHLTVLQELTWDAKYNEISDVMENEIRSICKHVPAIKIIL